MSDFNLTTDGSGEVFSYEIRNLESGSIYEQNGVNEIYKDVNATNDVLIVVTFHKQCDVSFSIS